MQDSVKLLITFPQSTNIEEMAQHLRSDYNFPQQVKVISKNKLRCSFETMADLLEIDFINTFGATATKVINSRTFSLQMNIKNQNFNHSYSNAEASDIQISQCQFRNGIFSDEIHFKTVLPRRVQRLTSLEDEVVQEQKLKQLLLLYNSNDQVALWKKPLPIDEKEGINVSESTFTHVSLQSQKEILIKKQQSIWAPLIGGLALTSVLVGGFKLMRMFIG